MTQPSEQDLHVLLIEDNPADATLLEELMEEGHYHVALYSTTNGFDAFDFLHRRARYRIAPTPDAILLDLGLPRLNGYEVLAQIRKTPQLAKIPVIVLTTSRDAKDKESCLALGAQEFISKPFNLNDYELLVDNLANVILPNICKKAA